MRAGYRLGGQAQKEQQNRTRFRSLARAGLPEHARTLGPGPAPAGLPAEARPPSRSGHGSRAEPPGEQHTNPTARGPGDAPPSPSRPSVRPRLLPVCFPACSPSPRPPCLRLALCASAGNARGLWSRCGPCSPSAGNTLPAGFMGPAPRTSLSFLPVQTRVIVPAPVTLSRGPPCPAPSLLAVPSPGVELWGICPLTDPPSSSYA